MPHKGNDELAHTLFNNLRDDNFRNVTKTLNVIDRLWLDAYWTSRTPPTVSQGASRSPSSLSGRLFLGQSGGKKCTWLQSLLRSEEGSEWGPSWSYTIMWNRHVVHTVYMCISHVLPHQRMRSHFNDSIHFNSPVYYWVNMVLILRWIHTFTNMRDIDAVKTIDLNGALGSYQTISSVGVDDEQCAMIQSTKTKYIHRPTYTP